MKGSIKEVPKLPPMPVEPEPTEPPIEKTENSKSRKPSGPKEPDPYEQDNSSMLMPILIAIGAFLPVLFCLCKL